MNLNTLKALDIWLKMYSAEELELLKLKCGETTVTFEETLLARYENSTPRGSVINFKANCAKIVVANKLWIYKIGEINSVTYETWMKSLKPDHFKKRTSINFGFEKEQQALKLNADKFEKISKDFMKTRTGDSEMGEEYDLEREWLTGDLNLLESLRTTGTSNLSVSTSDEKADNAKAEENTKNYESSFFNSEGRKKNKLKFSLSLQSPSSSTPDKTPDKTPDFLKVSSDIVDNSEHGSNVNERVVFKNVGISSTLKGFKTGHLSNREGFSNNVSETTGDRTVDTFSVSDLILDYQKFDPIDTMERYLQKFDCLFYRECL